jgi:hypothetical protein
MFGLTVASVRVATTATSRSTAWLHAPDRYVSPSLGPSGAAPPLGWKWPAGWPTVTRRRLLTRAQALLTQWLADRLLLDAPPRFQLAASNQPRETMIRIR